MESLVRFPRQTATATRDKTPRAGALFFNRRYQRRRCWCAVHAKTEPTNRLDRLARTIIGAALEAHRHLGRGFLESLDEEALAVELSLRGVPFVRQKPFGLSAKGHEIGEGWLDLLVGDELLVEPKAVEALAPIHEAQVISSLKATGCHLGPLLSFNVPVLKTGIQRVVYS